MTAPDFLNVQHLTKTYSRRGLNAADTVYALNDVSFSMQRGEVLGLVGESGSGKSTLGRALLRLIPSTQGVVEYEGMDLLTLKKNQFAPYRQRLQMIFQDPYASLNPRLTVGQAIREVLLVHRLVHKKTADERVIQLLNQVGIPAEKMHAYPHEFSGGQRQRVVIARALAVNPEFIVADEPVSALDVSVQAQVINLLKELKKSLQLSLLFIAHDLAVVAHIADRIMVMYQGELMELAPCNVLLNAPVHPYTHYLLSAIPNMNPQERKYVEWAEDVSLPQFNTSSKTYEGGCPFSPRCRFAMPCCYKEKPPMKALGGGQSSACWLHQEKNKD